MARRVDAPLAAIVPDVATGLRAAAATLVPFYLAASLGRPELAWTALGGWLGTLVDPGGSRGSRARQFVAFTLAGAACVAGAGLAGRDARLGAPALALVAFVGSLLRALGAAGASLGTMLTIVAAVGLSRTGGDPARDALYFAAGATWATLLSTVVWPVWTHLPVRRALAAVFHEMAAYAAAVDECAGRGAGADDARWAALAGLHRRRIRDAVEAARAMATAVRARRPGEGRVGSNLRVLLGLAEAQFALLVALAESIAAEPAGAPARRLREALRAAGRRHEDVRRELLVTAIGPARASGRAEGAAAASPDEAAASLRPGDVLAERLLRASALSRAVAGDLDAPTESVEGEPAAEHGPGRSPREAARVLAAALAPRSAIFRHALRVAGAAAAAFALGRLLSPAHTHWVTITAVSILQPYPGASLTRAVERIGGTLLGCLVAIGLTAFVRAPALLAAALVPLSVAAIATKPRSYRLFTFFLTPVFVLLAERYPGDWWTAAARVGDTLAGGFVALVAAFVTFPAWEHRRLPETLGATFKAVGRYADAVLGSLAESGARRDEALVAAARRDAGVALGEAETALEHALAEPVRDARSTADAMQLVTFARRLAGALTALATHALEDERASDEPRPAGRRAAPAAARGVAGDVARAALAYVTGVLRDAEAFARGEAVSGRAHAPPALPPDLGAHARGLVERVLNLTALTAGLLSPPPAAPAPPAGRAPA